MGTTIEPQVTEPAPPDDDVSLETEVQQVDATESEYDAEPTDGTEATTAEGRARDEKGRFVPDDAAAEDAPRFAPAVMNVATQYMTQEEIDSTPNAAMVLDIVRGRMAAVSQQATPQEQPAPPPQDKPPSPTELDEFVLNLSEEEQEGLSPELAQSLKGLTGYVNKLKGSLDKLHAQNMELSRGVQQSAQTQNAGFWDEIAASVPGMIDAIGKPSTALINNGTAQAGRWRELAPLIVARAQAQNVPQGMMDFSKAASEAWSMYQTLNGNTNTTGANGRPGTAVRGAPRLSVSPRTAPKDNMSAAEDHEYRLAKLEQIFAANGGRNPFS